MSNVNNFEFAKHLDAFKLRMIDPQVKRIAEAQAIMDNPLHQWAEGQFALAETKLKSFKDWLAFYQTFYDQGLKLCTQHETLVGKMAKWYGVWRDDVSNEGKQEIELMSSQADMLNEIFSEMFKELQPLKLDIKPPKGLNL